MTRFQELLLNVSLFLSMVTLIKARITVNKCQDSSPKASCRQECYEDCKMSCGQADPQLKSCEQTCLDHGQCDLKCATKETCHQDCEALLTCGSVFCKTANCTQRCDEGICKMSCRATSGCKQLCNAGSCQIVQCRIEWQFLELGNGQFTKPRNQWVRYVSHVPWIYTYGFVKTPTAIVPLVKQYDLSKN